MKLCIYISLHLSSRNKSASGLSPQEKFTMLRELKEWWVAVFLTCDTQIFTGSLQKGRVFEQTYKWFTINSIMYSVLAAIKLFFSFVEQPGIHQRQPRPALKKINTPQALTPLSPPAPPVCPGSLSDKQSSMWVWGQMLPIGIREIWINSFSYEVSITL